MRELANFIFQEVHSVRAGPPVEELKTPIQVILGRHTHNFHIRFHTLQSVVPGLRCIFDISSLEVGVLAEAEGGDQPVTGGVEVRSVCKRRSEVS